jgi:hypothetical protein
MNMVVLLDVAPCSPVEFYRRFRGPDDDDGFKYLWNVRKILLDHSYNQ